MASEKFCLRWNDFETNISSAFRELRDDKDFFDVTLACDDEQIQAHKVILSACSPFFRGVLRRNPHAHPLLYLKGVKYSDLQSVLNFMYHGEVNVAQEELNSFLAVAEELRVKGLTQNNQSGGSSQQSKKESSYPSAPRPAPSHLAPRLPSPAPPPKKPRPAPSYAAHHDDDDIQELPTVKTEPVQAAAAAAEPYTVEQGGGQLQQVDDGMVGYDEEGYEDYGQYGEEGGYGGAGLGQDDKGSRQAVPAVAAPEDLLEFCVRDQAEGKWSCGLCYQFAHRSRQNVRNHVESRHYPATFQYSCPSCDKVCNTMRALEVHKSSVHRQTGY